MNAPDFATVEDVIALWRNLSVEEQERVSALLPVVSDSLRVEARKVGKDLDDMIHGSRALRNVARSVTVDVVARAIMTPSNEAPMTQFSQSGLGYTQSGTYLVPGGGLFIKRSELARLGLRRQKIGIIEPFGAAREKCHNDEAFPERVQIHVDLQEAQTMEDGSE